MSDVHGLPQPLSPQPTCFIPPVTYMLPYCSTDTWAVSNACHMLVRGIPLRDGIASVSPSPVSYEVKKGKPISGVCPFLGSHLYVFSAITADRCMFTEP